MTTEFFLNITVNCKIATSLQYRKTSNTSPQILLEQML